MSCPLDPSALEKLKAFIDICRKNPDILHIPALSFFKEFIESFGGTIPPKKMPKTEETKPASEPEEQEKKCDSEPESDLELDNEGCIDPDELADIEMGGEIKELTEEETDKAQEIRRKAIELFNEGELEKSITTYSEAIALDPSSALSFAKRGQAHLRLNKPNACIRDCTKALELNPDSAAAYKFRGRAYRMLGKWEEAAKDLRQACKIDFDEQSDEWLKEVTPNAKKIEQHRLKLERKKQEKEEKEKLERLRKVKEAREKAARENLQAEDNEPPTGEMPGAAGMGDFYKLFQDPEVLTALKDPEVAAAIQDISTNPANFIKHQSNPKVMALLSKLGGKFQGGMPGGFPGGMPGGFPGGMPGGFPGGMSGGFPGGMPGGFPGGFSSSAPPKNEFQDDNLD